ncbi:MalY/PatB family protein [Radiobacillus sp. PE A8.2]|uniref:MalY/PatB family protein n=1 Tax=Radiobacillus sp. PE A8.2 TaxID=3380349 RepID=UPI00388DC322
MSDFDVIHDRLGTRSAKWDLTHTLFGSKEVLPMWVADMDFKIPEPVIDALVERAKHGIFGYTLTDPTVTDTVKNWVMKRHQWDIHKSWIIYSPGVITTLHMAVQSLTAVGDSILIQTPVYPPFYQVIEKHDRKLVKNPLKLVNNRYEIDFDDFEEKLKRGVKAFILCNPHNPVGRVWTKEELQKLANLCIAYDVLILSDEIHADLIMPAYTHIPIASLSEKISEQTITCMSPTKTFNLAGIQVSYAVIADQTKREKMEEYFHKQGFHMLNTMAVTAIEAAYTDGEAWLDDLIHVIDQNKQLVHAAFENRDEIDVIELEGTYLIWLDCRSMGLSHEELKAFMQEKAFIGLNDGISFGEEGTGFMRLNIACPKATVQVGLNRILNALDAR